MSLFAESIKKLHIENLMSYLFYGTTADGYQLNLRFIDYMKYLEITLEEAEE